MNENAVFRVASSEIVADDIDDGIVVVNLASGSYYTLDGVAREIWEALTAGRRRNEIVAGLAQRYDGSGRQIEEGVDALLARLQEEGLVIESEPGDRPEIAGGSENALRLPFSEPVLVRYTDMEDLLNLDPIHEVDEAGWPQVKVPEGR